MNKENKNFLLNVVYQILTYLFPLITAAYVSRILGVENIGIYSYSYSIVYMFMLVAMLGISNHGNRCVAKVREDKDALSKTFWEIYHLQLMVGFIVCCFYFLFLIIYHSNNKNIFVLQTIFLLSVLMDINWLYFGLEKFKITITRNLIIKIISIVFIFLLVNEASDLWIYTLIMGIATFLSQLYLVLLLKKYVKFQRFSFHSSIKHLRSCLVLFVPVLAYGVYRVMDKIMIGALSTQTELGFYENAEKIINIPIMIITALGTVMLPHMANLFKDEGVEYQSKIYSSMKIALLFSTIASGGLILIGQDLAVVLFGEAFFKSGGIIQLLSVTVIASAWANVIRTQFLIPTNRDKIYVISTIFGALVNLILNVIFIPRLGAYGACIGTIFAEFSVMIYQSVYTRQQLEIGKYCRLLLIYLVSAILVIGLTYCATFWIGNRVIRLICRIAIAIILFIIFHYNYIMFEFLGCKKRSKDVSREES